MKLPEIVKTNLRPDMVLCSVKTKQFTVTELMIPLSQSNERKQAKYNELLAECIDKGWQTLNYPVEIWKKLDVESFPATSV